MVRFYDFYMILYMFENRWAKSLSATLVLVPYTGPEEMCARNNNYYLFIKTVQLSVSEGTMINSIYVQVENL